MKRILLLLLMSASAVAADPAESTGFVTSLPISPVTVAAGKPVAASLRFRVKNGYHINSNQPHSDLLIPTRLKLDPPTDLGVGKITYPEGTDIALSFSPEEKLNVYNGDFTVSARLSSVRTAAPGHYRVHGELSYQACSDNACYPPKNLPVSFDVTVLKSRILTGHASREHNPPQSPHIHN